MVQDFHNHLRVFNGSDDSHFPTAGPTGFNVDVER
jgi:hypothetical protein